MEDHNQHIDRYFREQLGNYTEQPAPDVWAALEQRLDDKPRKKRVLWIWFSILFFAAIGGTAFYAYNKGKHAAIPRADKITATSASITPFKTQKIYTNSVASPSPQKAIATASPGKKAKRQQDLPVSSTPLTTSKPTLPETMIQPRPQAESVPQPGAITSASETPIIKQASVQPVEPAKTEIKKPDAEPDILQMMPVAGINVPPAKIDEEEYQALAPVSGKMKVETKTVTESTLPVAKLVTDADSIKITSHSEPAKASEIQSPPVESNAASQIENDRINRFSAGLKTGYEFGTKPYHANSFVVSPYLQYNFSKRVGLLLQPAFKYSHSSAAVLSYGSYTQITDSFKELIPPLAPNAGTGFPTGQDTYMAYQKTYDSIVIRSQLKDIRYWNLDLPLMLSYKVHKNFSVYAGPAFHFTRVPKVVTTKQTVSTLVVNDTMLMKRKPMSIEFDTLSIKDVFPQKGFDVSQYSSSAFDNPMINPFKMGVTFGLSYTFRKHFHFDILYRQTLSKMEYIHNERIREILKQPYIRVTLGFDLLK